jgi:phosphate transport system protein
MHRSFEDDLQKLKEQLLTMGGLAEDMIHRAVDSLVQAQVEHLNGLFEEEDRVNRMQIDIDERVLECVALHQPAGSDLRFLLGAARINMSLERLADQAVNIAQIINRLLAEPPLKKFVIIPEMVRIAVAMVRQSLDAFVSLDVPMARRVLDMDEPLDLLRDNIKSELIGFIRQDVDTASRCVDLILVAQNLERMGDLATNIAEVVIFVAEGRDVRHAGAPGAGP